MRRMHIPVDFKTDFTPKGVHYKLTLCENYMVSCIAVAMTAKEIGAMCGVSWQTVRRHLKNVFDKVGCSNRGEMLLMLGAYPSDVMDELEYLRSRVKHLENQLLWGGWNG